MTYIELKKEELESESALLEQYKKELADLENGVGLARVMSHADIIYAMNDLRAHIVIKEKSVSMIKSLIQRAEEQDAEFERRLTELMK